MRQAREREVAEPEPVCTQLLQKANFLDLGFEARRPLARRHGAEPFETADPAILNWRQQARQPRFSVGPGNRGDGFEQGLLLVHAALDKQYHTLLEQPVPMLGNLTPRSAARTKSGREKLAVWLKHLENRSRQPEATDPMATYDFAWLWRELKVEDLRR
jgi:hypothetical protein